MWIVVLLYRYGISNESVAKRSPRMALLCVRLSKVFVEHTLCVKVVGLGNTCLIQKFSISLEEN